MILLLSWPIHLQCKSLYVRLGTEGSEDGATLTVDVSQQWWFVEFIWSRVVLVSVRQK